MKISDKTKIIDFLKKIKKQTGVNNVVIGMSGGIDSTVVFFLLKEVYKPENIFPAILNYYPKNNADILKILKTAKIQNKNILDISIKSIVDSFNFDVDGWRGERALRQRGVEGFPPKRALKGVNPSQAPSSLTLGNIMARVRMILLFDLAKKVGGLVCGTENKSEHLLGYFTRFGDAASDIEPISHLFKTEVYKLAKNLIVPITFITKKPSANLWEDQTDEGEFGFTYKEADKVMELYFDKKNNIMTIKKRGFKNAEKIIKRVLNNRFKQLVPYHL